METVLALMIVSGAFVASLNTIAGARASQAIVSQQRLGLLLAEDMLAEVLSQPYRESGGVFGLEPGERTGDRTMFDDIDDYAGWESAPPTNADGSAIPGAEAYRRVVDVSYVRVNSPATLSSTDQGIQRIVVTVYHGKKRVAQLISYRSDVYDSSMVGY